MTLKSPFTTFLQESRRFIAAQTFFLESNIVALKESPKLNASLEKFRVLVKPEYKDPYTYLNSRLFIAYVSSFEVFLQDLTTLVLRIHPVKIGSTIFTLKDIINSSSTEHLIELAIDSHLNKLMYERPQVYLSKICNLLSIPKNAIEPLWPQFVEAKARRDLGVHANWRCNATYIRKIEEVGLTSMLKVGDSAVPDTQEYIDPLSDSLEKLAEIMTDQVVSKHGKREERGII